MQMGLSFSHSAVEPDAGMFKVVQAMMVVWIDITAWVRMANVMNR